MTGELVWRAVSLRVFDVESNQIHRFFIRSDALSDFFSTEWACYEGLLSIFCYSDEATSAADMLATQ